MKKLFAILMTGVFVLPLTLATLTYAQDAPADKDKTASTGKAKKEKKAAKTKGEKKSKGKKDTAASGK